MSDLEKYRSLINHEEDGSSDELSDFLRKSSSLKVPSKKSKEDIWKNIADAIEEDRSDQKKPYVWRLVGIAASIALIVTFSILFLSAPEQIEIATASGEKTTQVLPDGSKVILNASSVITYSDDWNRELKLEGEAFFEVTEGEKFLVKTDFGNVQVLGTSFNVFARDGDFKVACKTGKVRVTVPKRLVSEDIVPGQAITVDADTVKVVFRVPETMGNWQKGEFYFDHQPISEVFEELQRQFSIEIEFEGSGEQEFSGYFTNKSLETALDMVCLPLGLEYQKTGQNTFAISKSAQ